MNAYDEKYGMDSNTPEIKAFHSSRRMFAIKGGELYLSPLNVDYSHAKWFEIEGWVTPENDSLMDILTRGYADAKGVFFYRGYDFRLDEESELEMMGSLGKLVREASVDVGLHLFGGKIKQEQEGEWPPVWDYGTIRELL